MALAIQAMGRQKTMAKNMSAVDAHGFLKYLAWPSKSSPCVWYTAQQSQHVACRKAPLRMHVPYLSALRRTSRHLRGVLGDNRRDDVSA